MNRHCWLAPPCRAHCTTAAPSFLAEPRSSSTLPLLRLTSTYHFFRSRVFWSAEAWLTTTAEPATTTMARPAHRPRRASNRRSRCLGRPPRAPSPARCPPPRDAPGDVGEPGTCLCSRSRDTPVL